MNKKELIKIVDNFKGKKIGVIGDLMLDQFIWGDVERISPEAPVPVVFVERESFIPGGAGNTANNISALGGKTFIVGLAGEDHAGQKLEKELKKRRINTKGILKSNKKPTTQKIRVIARNQQVVRIDKENCNDIIKKTERKTINFISSQIQNWDGLVISNYAKGFITENLVQEIISLSKKHQKFIIVDTKPKQAFYFKDVFLLTPNLREAKEISGKESLEEAGKAIQEKLNCNVLITQAAEGMTLFEKDKIKHFPAKAKEVFDVSGAGDTVVGILALSLASGANLEEAAIIANHGAGIVVGKIGTAVVSPQELKKDLENNG